jgi:2'-5' RNA ligase
MAFIGIQVPHSTARLFGDIEVPGNKTPSASMHVTILYMGKDVPIDDLAEAVKATYAVTARTRPFTVRTTRVSSFPSNPDDQDGYPIIARIESDDLHEFREALAASFDAAGLDYSKKFPEYKPHVTVSYSPEPVEDVRIPTIEWGAHEIVMWGGDEGDRKLTATFPLVLMRADVTARRVAERFRMASQPSLR